MSELVGNPKDLFSRTVAEMTSMSLSELIYEPPRGKTNNVVSEQV